MGSRGSVIPFFIQMRDEDLFITDFRMTRFMISLEDGVDLVLHALDDMCGGEIYVKIPSMIKNLAEVVAPGFLIKKLELGLVKHLSR